MCVWVCVCMYNDTQNKLLTNPVGNAKTIMLILLLDFLRK